MKVVIRRSGYDPALGRNHPNNRDATLDRIRDVCPHCERSYQVCKGGRLRKHISRGTGKPCPVVRAEYAPPEPQE